MDTKAYLYRQEAMKRWILLFIVSLFSLFVLGTYAIAAERYYDESGRYQGGFKTTTKISAKLRPFRGLNFFTFKSYNHTNDFNL